MTLLPTSISTDCTVPETGDLISVSEIPVGTFHSDDKECIYMIVAEHNGVFYNNLSSDFLEYKLGTNPFHIYVVDCLKLATTENPLLLKIIFQSHLHAITQIERTFVQYPISLSSYIFNK